jgi:hypothetical protein
MTTNSALGAVYLAASSHERTVREMASRILASMARRPIRIAATYAAAGGPMASASRTSDFIGRLFDGADVRRFTVAGENGTGVMAPDDAGAIVQEPTSCSSAAVIPSWGPAAWRARGPTNGSATRVPAGPHAWGSAPARSCSAPGGPSGPTTRHPAPRTTAESSCRAPASCPTSSSTATQKTTIGTSSTSFAPCCASGSRLLRREPRLLRREPRLIGQERLAPEARPRPPPRFLGLPTGTGIVIGPDGLTTEVGGAPVPL